MKEKKKKRNLTIVLDNRMYLTHVFLGLIIANCDFRKAANQRKLGGHPRRGTKTRGTPAVGDSAQWEGKENCHPQ